MVAIRIGNRRRGDGGEYVGRPANPTESKNPLANPFYIGRSGNRLQVIGKYRRWLWQRIRSGDEAVVSELHRLLGLARRKEGVTLLCWCKPQPCHADVIQAALGCGSARTGTAGGGGDPARGRGHKGVVNGLWIDVRSVVFVRTLSIASRSRLIHHLTISISRRRDHQAPYFP